MRQVPFKNETSESFSCYGLIGNGQLARHLAHYLNLLKIPFVKWSRHSKTPLSKALKKSSHILVSITDSAIEPFIIQNRQAFSNKVLVHFSGALFTPLATGVHPLMTFSRQLYDETVYRKIHFVIDTKARLFQDTLPHFPNSHSVIEPLQKDKYHALCVMAGNFSSILWQVFFTQLKNDFGIPKSQAITYLQQTFKNIAALEKSLTGPLQRNDKETIKMNLRALENSPPLHDTYKAFLKLRELL